MARIIFPILYIIFQHPGFFLLSKLSLLTEMAIVKHSHNLTFELPNIVLEVGMCAVWALSKEQRVGHLDSRKGYFLSFAKQLVFYTLIGIENISESLHEMDDKLFLSIFLLVVLLLIDLSEFYYFDNFRNILVKLDLFFIAGMVLILFDSNKVIGFYSFLIASVFAVTLIIVEYSVSVVKC